MTKQKSAPPLRLMIYDDTCRGSALLPGLTHSWIAGASAYRWKGRLDYTKGVTSWAQGLEWLATVEEDREIAEVQFWGHGKWGRAKVDDDVLDVEALKKGHPYRPLLEAIRRRLVGPDALWWFRTCETFGCVAGHDFARRWCDFLHCRAAGHTYIIGLWQSGLHLLAPGQQPDWPVEEGLSEGTPEEPTKALWSKPGEPNTITCLHNRHPILR